MSESGAGFTALTGLVDVLTAGLNCCGLDSVLRPLTIDFTVMAAAYLAKPLVCDAVLKSMISIAAAAEAGA